MAPRTLASEMTSPIPQTKPVRSIFLSVVIPAFNEEVTIKQVVYDHIRILAAVEDQVKDWEIVCVDDASCDRTLEILRGISLICDKVRILHHETNRGIYQSFADGFAAARGTHVYETGADGQWPAENLRKMLPLACGEADLIVGERPNRREIYSLARRWVSFAFNLLPRLLWGIETRDAGSVKLGVREVFQLPLISCSPFAEAERILRARRRGLQVDFVEVEFRPRAGGKARGASWRNILQSARDVLRCAIAYGLGGSSPAPKRKSSQTFSPAPSNYLETHPE